MPGLNAVAVIGVLIPLMAIVAVAAIIIVVIYVRHKERMAYLSGAQPPAPPPYPPPYPSQPNAARQPYAPMPRAILHPLPSILNLTGIGLGITVGLLPIGFGPWLIVGLIPLFIGLVRLGLMFLEPPAPPPSAVERQLWLRRGLWTGAIGLALLIGLATIGFGPWELPATITLGYGLGQLAAYLLEPRTRRPQPPEGL